MTLGRVWWRACSRWLPWCRGTLRSRVASAFVSRGRGGTWRHPPSFCVAGAALRALGWLWWRAWTGLVAGGTAALCVAGVALGDIHLRFTWQVWHLATSTCVFTRVSVAGVCMLKLPIPSPPGQMDSGGAVLRQSSKEQSKPRTERLRKEVYE